MPESNRDGPPTSEHVLSPAMLAAMHAHEERLGGFLAGCEHLARRRAPGICDFLFGDPHDEPLPAMLDALQVSLLPRSADWYGYRRHDPRAREVVAAAIGAELRHAVAPEDVFLTTGAFGGLAVALRTICVPGHEVVVVEPSWFYYHPMILAAGGIPRPVAMSDESWALPLAGIEAAIGPRTCAVVINSPHNPTGRVFTEDELDRLVRLLERASAALRRPLYLLADESYRRIVFDGRRCPSPAHRYPWSLQIYTYGKTLLAPGLRLGWIALPSSMPDRPSMRRALETAQLVGGWMFPASILQRALPALEPLVVDVGALERRRDALVGGLREADYQLRAPEGGFYLMVRCPAPWTDDHAFAACLAEHGVLVLPGSLCGAPGHVRLSLTADDAMVERALPVLAGVARSGRAH